MASSTTRRNLLHRLPPDRLRLLCDLGRLADEKGIGLYLVGGVVRDLLLKQETWDLDLTVEGDGIAFARMVADRYGAGLALFERFATARLVMPGGWKLDIASTRGESYAEPAVLPVVKAAPLEQDLYRRDFTINAMAIGLNAGNFGRLRDPYGGQRDLRRKTLKVLHGGSFRDDPTRIFRAIRFMQRFGFRLEPETHRLLDQSAATNLIDRLSGPRLCNEILLLLNERRPDRAVRLLARLDLLRFLHRKLRYREESRDLIAVLPSVLRWWKDLLPGSEPDRPLVHLMALLAGYGTVVLRSVANRLQMSSAQSAAVAQAGRLTDRVAMELSHRNELRPSRIYRLLSGLPDEAVVLTAAKSRSLAGSNGARICRQRLARYLTRDRHIRIVVGGDDLKRLGLKPGPAFKRILDRLLDTKIDGGTTTEEAERALAARLAAEALERSRRLQ